MDRAAQFRLESTVRDGELELGTSKFALTTLRSSKCERKCQERTHSPTPEAKSVLKTLREGPALWLRLCKHLNEANSLFVLRVLAEYSDWYKVKRREEETLRKEYLAHVRACKSCDPDWVHHAVNARLEAALRQCEDDD